MTGMQPRYSFLYPSQILQRKSRANIHIVGDDCYPVMSGSISADKAELHSAVMEALQNFSETFHLRSAWLFQDPVPAPKLDRWPASVPREITLNYVPTATYPLLAHTPHARPGPFQGGRHTFH